MKNRYQIIAMRSLLGGFVDCEPYQAERWDVVDLVVGRTVGMTRTEVDAKAVVHALDAVAELEARAAAAERCRQAIAMALGADVDTLEAGVLALLADRASLAEKVLSCGRVLDMELGNLLGVDFTDVRDLLVAQAALDEVRGVKP